MAATLHHMKMLKKWRNTTWKLVFTTTCAVTENGVKSTSLQAEGETTSGESNIWVLEHQLLCLARDGEEGHLAPLDDLRLTGTGGLQHVFSGVEHLRIVS